MQDSAFTVRQSFLARTVPKNFLGAAKIALYCATKLLGTAKVAKIARFLYCFWEQPKNFLGAAKIARFSLYCATKVLGTAKVARFTVPKNFLGAAKIARFSLYCATKLLGTAKVARFTVPKNFLGDWKVKSANGEHQSPAQWPHTRIFPVKTKPVNIRKHDRLHGAKPSLNIAPPFFPLIQNYRTDHKIRRMGSQLQDSVFTVRQSFWEQQR